MISSTGDVQITSGVQGHHLHGTTEPILTTSWVTIQGAVHFYLRIIDLLRLLWANELKARGLL